MNYKFQFPNQICQYIFFSSNLMKKMKSNIIQYIYMKTFFIDKIIQIR